MTVNLKDVGSGFKRTAINDNFNTIESTLNNDVLMASGSRPLEGDLDLNSNNLLNGGLASFTQVTVNGEILDPDGTGVTTLPTQTGNAGKHLVTNGSSALWETDGALTLSAAIASTTLGIGQSVVISDRSYGIFDVVLSSGVTPNTYDVIQCTGVPELALVLRVDTYTHIGMFGAVGDGITDDTGAIEAWWSSSNTLNGAGNTYLYKGAGLAKNSLVDNFVLSGNGMVLDCQPTSNQYYAIRLRPDDSARFKLLRIVDLDILGNSQFAYGIRIDEAAAQDSYIEDVVVRNVTVDGLDNADLATVSSTSGIRVDCNSSNTNISDNFVSQVTRTQVNPGSVSSTGIFVNNATSLVSIKNNNVRNITSPVGDADADGIVVFGPPEKLDTPAVEQSGSILIENNKITIVKGRFCKLQTANAKFINNFCETEGIDLITNFTGVDCQIGGCTVSDNIIRIEDPVDIESAAFVGLQNHDYGGLEAAFFVHDNLFITKQDIAYGIKVTADGTTTNTSVSVKDNIARSEVGSSFKITNFLYLTLPEQAEKFVLDIEGNKVSTGAGALISSSSTAATNWSDPVKGPVMSDYTTLIARNNTNLIPTTNSDIINSSNVIPYLQDFVFADNNGYNRSSLSLKGVDITLLPEGNVFYFSTDGGAGGLLNAPTGYDRNVLVETPGRYHKKITKNQGTDFVISRADLGTWYEYQGTVVP